MEKLFAVVPYIDLPEMTAAAVDDILAQDGVRTEVLLISNGSSEDSRKQIEARQRGSREWQSRVHTWFHHPPLLTLNATWNAALDFCWAAGAEVAWVVNNDVRLHPSTAANLLEVFGTHESKPFFVSAVGVRPALPEPYEFSLSMRGGPDFSCYLIGKACHEKYRFDENFTYVGDLDLHRRIMLGGDGDRIFSVNVPYLHFASQTIAQASPQKQAMFRATADLHHRIYTEKWGGDVNQETLVIPYSAPAHGGVCTTTPDLQAHRCAGFHRDDGTPLDPDSLRTAIENRKAALPSEGDGASVV